MLALKQKKTMTILAMCILPVVCAIIGEEMFHAGEVVAALFLLIPLGVVWASSRYKIELRRLQEQQLQQFYAAQQHVYALRTEPETNTLVVGPSAALMSQLDIAPTLHMYQQTSDAFARAYWHWFFLIKAAPVPETLIGADPAFFIRRS